jgi:hypothetical protein
LSLRGGRESAVRLVATAFAVAVGVAMLLATLASINALGAQNARGAWLATSPPFAGGNASPAGQGNSTTSSNVDPLWWLVNTEQFGDQLIVKVDVAATGAHSPVPPGIARVPGPGQYYVSPALETLLSTVPVDQLGARFKGSQIGVIGPNALPSPSDLIIVVGDRADALAHVPGAGEITGFSTSSSSGGSGGPDSLGSSGLQFVLALLALVLLFPVLVFIATATRLSAARREQRFAAIRLVGATLGQLTVISAVDAAVAASLGVAVGFILYLPLSPAMTHVSLTGQSFARGDLSIGLVDVLVVALGVPIAAVITARVALRRVRISPLGVSRRATPSPPRFYRMIPLLAGIAELAYFVAVGRPKSAGAQTQAYFSGFLLVMIGLVVAGPWLTMAGSRVMARRTSSASMLVAGRRLSDNPRGAFRAISGLILALFVTSVSFGLITTLLVDHGALGSGSLASETVIDQFEGNAFSNVSLVASVPAAVVNHLRAVPGVKGVTLDYAAPSSMKTSGPIPDINGLGGDITYGVLSCKELKTTPALGHCRRGAALAAVGDDIAFMPVTKSVSIAASTTWPAAHLAHGLTDLRVQLVAVATNGSAATIARVQTILETAFPFTSSTSQFGEITPQNSQLLTELKSTSEIVIVASLLIAGCSLAVAMAAGVIERKRPFSLLRLCGVPVAVLRRIVALETALPLVVISLASAAIGLLASDLFLRSQLGLTLRMPGSGYFAIVLGGLVVSLAIIGSTLSLLEPITRLENARME